MGGKKNDNMKKKPELKLEVYINSGKTNLEFGNDANGYARCIST